LLAAPGLRRIRPVFHNRFSTVGTNRKDKQIILISSCIKYIVMVLQNGTLGTRFLIGTDNVPTTFSGMVNSAFQNESSNLCAFLLRCVDHSESLLDISNAHY
jgi:hypothetical protein